MVRRASARSYAAVVEDTTADEAALADFLDTLKFDANGLLVASAQDVDTGAILMQAFANREAVADTLRRGKATFYSRSRSALWTKGETSNNFIQVYSVHVDCDRDSLIYLGAPLGPACHTGADTCFYQRVDGSDGLAEGGEGLGPQAALSTLFQLEATIEERRTAPIADGAKPSWTRKLLDDPELLCSKVREEADELARAWEDKEGKEAAASEMADVLYHAMVLLNKQGKCALVCASRRMLLSSSRGQAACVCGGGVVAHRGASRRRVRSAAEAIRHLRHRREGGAHSEINSS